MIKIGQIGMAHDHAPGFMAVLRKYPDVFDIVGIAEDDPSYARKFVHTKFKGEAVYEGIPLRSTEELLSVPGLQAVVVETEEASLIDYAYMAVERGLHVHIDKPAGTDLQKFRRLLRMAESKKRTVQMGYMYRYFPAVQYCLEQVKAGALGRIYQVDAIMDTLLAPAKREWTNRFPGGNMFYLGCHMVDLVLLLAGMPERIHPYNKSTGIDGIDAVDHAFAVFEYKNGISTVRATLTESAGFARRQLVVCGEKGVMEIKPLETALDTPANEVSVSYVPDALGPFRTEVLPSAAGRYDAMMLDFADMVEGRKQNPYSYEYEYTVQKAILAACGLPVELHNDDW